MISSLSIYSKKSRSGFIRYLLTQLKGIPQLSHPSEFKGVRSRYTHTRNMCKAVDYLNKYFVAPQTLWHYIVVYIACHDIGHTPYGHAGERIVRRLYMDNFSNSSQSNRFMFVDDSEWPNHIKPLSFYESTPIIKPSLHEEIVINKIVKFFDNLENAIGDAIDLRLMGQSRALNFLNNNCSWSSAVDFEITNNVSCGMFELIKSEFHPNGFESLYEGLCDGNHKALISINELREIVDEERAKCTYVQKMDARAEKDIPKAYELIRENLINFYGRAYDESFINIIAIDILSSAGTVKQFSI